MHLRAKGVSRLCLLLHKCVTCTCHVKNNALTDICILVRHQKIYYYTVYVLSFHFLYRCPMFWLHCRNVYKINIWGYKELIVFLYVIRSPNIPDYRITRLPDYFGFLKTTNIVIAFGFSLMSVSRSKSRISNEMDLRVNTCCVRHYLATE